MHSRPSGLRTARRAMRWVCACIPRLCIPVAQHTRAFSQEVICNKLYDARVPVRRQANVCQVVGGHVVQTGIVDLEVDHSVVLELKANHASISSEHQAQLRRYLRSLAADAHSDRRMLGAVLLFAKDGTLRVWRAEPEPA